MAFLEIINVSKSYGNKQILKNINLKLDKSSFTSLLGLSGCGKTTLLRIIAGLESVDSGKIFLEGKDITLLPTQKRNFGIVYQNFALFPHMTVFENIAYGLKIKKIDTLEIQQKVEAVLKKVNLLEKQKQNVTSLSGGEQQRVALARAIVTEPEMILLDEPLSNLDQSLRIEARKELKRLQNEIGITTIYVTHDQSEALALSNTISVMNQGEIVQVGTPNEIYFKPTDLFTADFVGHYNFFDAQNAKHLFNIDISEETTLALLPENIHLNSNNSNNNIVIKDILFSGIFTEYILETNHKIIQSVMPTNMTNKYKIGDFVSIIASKEHFILMQK